MEEIIILNEHNKEEFPPMHSCEHLINQTMIRLFQCGRSINAHIERKKSKLDYKLSKEPSEVQVQAIELQVNDIIAQHLPVTVEYISQEEAQKKYDLGKLPENASETLRIVKIGDYDACPCIGKHVENTSEIGELKILSHSYENGIFRIRFKLISE